MIPKANIKPLLFISVSIIFISCLFAENKTAEYTSLKNNERINGVSFVASNEPVVDSDFIAVKNINANWVALMPFAFMRYIDSPGLRYNSKRQWRGETVEGIIEVANAFEENGIAVMIKPQIWTGRGEFSGFINMHNERDWVSFEQEYKNFILDYARAAKQVHAAIFCIGTELNKFATLRPAFWNELIDSVRANYNGKITYAENWDTYEDVPFWNKLDYIGIDAYFPIQIDKDVTVSGLQNGWKNPLQKMEAISKKMGKQILFAEYGYRNADYCAKEPWLQDNQGINNKNQQLALQVLYDELWSKEWFAGGFLWKWYQHRFRKGEVGIDYTVQDKPAEEVVKKKYGE